MTSDKVKKLTEEVNRIGHLGIVFMLIGLLGQSLPLGVIGLALWFVTIIARMRLIIKEDIKDEK